MQPKVKDERSSADADKSYPVTGHHLGDEVEIQFFPSQSSTPCGEVVGVHFGKDKVTYDVDLTLGGETLRNVDSAFVKAAGKRKRN
jgi:hypothetical protein